MDAGVHDAMESSVPRKCPKRTPKMATPENIVRLRRARNEAWKHLMDVQLQHPEQPSVWGPLRAKYDNLRKSVKEAVKQQRRSELEIVWNEVGEAARHKDSQRFFRVLDMAKGQSNKSMPSFLEAENGCLVVNQRERGRMWRKTFQGDVDTERTEEVDDDVRRRLQEIEKSVEDYVGSTINRDIETSEVLAALKHLKLRKACGFDDIANEMMKFGGDAMGQSL